MTWSDLIFWQIVLGGMLRLATPVFLAALGEVISERGGTLNLGIDGIMTAGAFSAVAAAAVLGWPAGLAAAFLTGCLYGLVMALAIVRGRANQIITGIALSLIGNGLTAYLFQLWQPSGQTMIFVPVAPVIAVPGLVEIPFFGPILFKQSLITYATVALLVVAVVVMVRTRIGLVLRAVGDSVASSELRGIDTARIRMGAIAIGAGFMGLGGGAITIGFLGSFNDGLTNGRGYIALAVVIIGRWSPLGAFFGALLFAFFDSLGLRAQTGLAFLPKEVFSILPYAMTLLVLILTARAKIAPRELGR